MFTLSLVVAVAMGLFGADYLLMAHERLQRWDVRPGLEARSTRRRLERILKNERP